MQPSNPQIHDDPQQALPHNGEANHNPRDQHEEVIPKDLPKTGTGMVALVAAIFVVLLAALFLIGYVPNHRREAKLDEESKASQDDRPVVSVAVVKRQEEGSDLLLPGTAEALQQTSIFPRANGYLKKQYVDIGDKVKAGQLLAEIDTPEVDAQLAQAQAAVLQSQANIAKAQNDFDLSKTTYDRYVSFGKTGGVTQQDVDVRQGNFTQAKANLDASKASLVASQADVQRLTATKGFQNIYAPFDGVISVRTYDVGALLSSNTNQPMFKIAQIDTLRVFVNVPQSYANLIKVDQQVKLMVSNYLGRDFAGTVARTSDSIDPTTRTLHTQVNFPNPKGELFAGMYGMVSFHIFDTKPPVLMPTSAIVYDASGLHVAVVKDGKVHLQNIKVGRDLGTEIEIASGLEDGQMIVSNPGERLYEGARVQYKEPQDQKTAAAPSKPQIREASAK